MTFDLTQLKDEKKSKSQLEMEMAAEALERQIVRFKNIDKESFTHSFRGNSITIGAGNEMILRLPEADHLAIHLARKILKREKLRNAPPFFETNLFPEAEIKELKEKILSEVESDPEPISKEDVRRKDLEDLQKKYAQTPQITVAKKDIIKDLESRGLKVDYSKSKEELLIELNEAEQKGIMPKA